MFIVNLRIDCYLMTQLYLGTKEMTSKGVETALEAWRTSKDVRIKMEAQTDSTSFQFRTPGTDRTKMDAQVAYIVGFGCT